MSPARVLVGENDALFGTAVAQSAQPCGYTVVGPVMRLDAGIRVAERDALEGALLDINLGSKQMSPIAESLRRRVPFLFLTGYQALGNRTRLRTRHAVDGA